MQVGDIRYRTFTGTDDIPWVCRCKVIKISPKGRVFTFWTLDCQRAHKFKDYVGGDKTSKTKVGALKKYQDEAIESYRWETMVHGMKNVVTTKERVERIIKAQKLIDKLTFCPTI